MKLVGRVRTYFVGTSIFCLPSTSFQFSEYCPSPNSVSTFIPDKIEKAGETPYLLLDQHWLTIFQVNQFPNPVKTGSASQNLLRETTTHLMSLCSNVYELNNQPSSGVLSAFFSQSLITTKSIFLPQSR